MAVEFAQVPAGVYVTQCRGTLINESGERVRCRVVLTYTADDLVVEWDRGVDYHMLTCPVCKSRQEG